MKMLKSFAFIFLLMGVSLNAQSISNHALGLRLGDSDGFGAEISYQKSITSSNRIEVDLGWRDSRNYSAFKLAGLYQWVRPIEGGFNWYYGVGGGLGTLILLLFQITMMVEVCLFLEPVTSVSSMISIYHCYCR